MELEVGRTGPTMFYQFADRFEILNSGGLYGRVNRDNFPDENDYRNPIIADAMRTLGYVNRFGRGIGRVREELVENGNGEPLFDTTQIGPFRITVSWTKFASEVKSSQRGAESSQQPAESSQTVGECAQETAESSQQTAESSQQTAESSQQTAESSQQTAECSRTLHESTQQLEQRVTRDLPAGIRSDAKINMIKVMKLIHANSAETAESMASKMGISMRGVQKILASLQKLGFIKHMGPKKAGQWVIVEG